jgi:hypothetical protein
MAYRQRKHKIFNSFLLKCGLYHQKKKSFFFGKALYIYILVSERFYF